MESRILMFSKVVLPVPGEAGVDCSLTWVYEDLKDFLWQPYFILVPVSYGYFTSLHFRLGLTASFFLFVLSWEKLICAENLIWVISSFSDHRQIKPLLGAIFKLKSRCTFIKSCMVLLPLEKACEILRASP